MKLRLFLKQKGQTSVEYLLMLVMAVGLGLTFFKKFQGYLLTNQDSYINIHMTFYKQLFDPQLGYKRFRLPR
jgi:hypothetical protein